MYHSKLLYYSWSIEFHMWILQKRAKIKLSIYCLINWVNKQHTKDLHIYTLEDLWLFKSMRFFILCMVTWSCYICELPLRLHWPLFFLLLLSNRNYQLHLPLFSSVLLRWFVWNFFTIGSVIAPGSSFMNLQSWKLCLFCMI